MTDARLYAPSSARNMQPICDVLQPLLPPRGLVLEIASGAGEHITRLARESPPELEFQPSDPGNDERRSIDAWRTELGLTNVHPAIAIDAASTPWPIERADVIFCINMIHISPWQATVGLFRNAEQILPKSGILFTYGPYRRGGEHTSAGNASFDASLRQRDTGWGIRDLEDLTVLAAENGLESPEIIEMPANNLSLVFRKS